MLQNKSLNNSKSRPILSNGNCGEPQFIQKKAYFFYCLNGIVVIPCGYSGITLVRYCQIDGSIF